MFFMQFMQRLQPVFCPGFYSKTDLRGTVLTDVSTVPAGLPHIYVF